MRVFKINPYDGVFLSQYDIANPYGPMEKHRQFALLDHFNETYSDVVYEMVQEVLY